MLFLGGDCMDGNVELLNYIYQNSEMGVTTINQLIGICDNEEYKTLLQSQLTEYTNINKLAEEKINELNKEAKEINTLAKASTYMMINMKTLLDNSPSHISEMLIQGGTMGIIDITKKIKEYPNADKEILDLADRLLKFEQKNIEESKKYLK